MCLMNWQGHLIFILHISDRSWDTATATPTCSTVYFSTTSTGTQFHYGACKIKKILGILYGTNKHSVQNCIFVSCQLKPSCFDFEQILVQLYLFLVLHEIFCSTRSIKQIVWVIVKYHSYGMSWISSILYHFWLTVNSYSICKLHPQKWLL